jgi:hypothetical protein
LAAVATRQAPTPTLSGGRRFWGIKKPRNAGLFRVVFTAYSPVNQWFTGINSEEVFQADFMQPENRSSFTAAAPSAKPQC